MRDYRELRVWQRAMDLVVLSYQLGAKLPRTEVYGLRSQLQKAAISVPANIAEGNGRIHLGEYVRFLLVANGSLMELGTHVSIAGRLGFLAPPEETEFLIRVAEVGKMLGRLIGSLRRLRQAGGA